jgi:glyoxylase-like metal-dependent hydrolase (beta-lactamase superfamily II)
MSDLPLTHAEALLRAELRAPVKLAVQAFMDEASHTISYVVHDPMTRRGAVIDSVLDFDAAAARTATRMADDMIAHIQKTGITLDWLLETHAHADHLSAACHIQRQCGGRLAIGRDIIDVQQAFGEIFNAGTGFAADGSQFDQLFSDGDVFSVGDIPALALHVPGHTPADMAYIIGDAIFCGDTLFMPDYGTARADFPGGDARQLYRSIRRLLSLPGAARLFVCHDYKAPGRDHFAWETTLAAQRAGNLHVHDGVSEDDFVAMRTARDATLAMPSLILPAVQVNMRGGQLPPPEANGTRYLKLPLDRL